MNCVRNVFDYFYCVSSRMTKMLERNILITLQMSKYLLHCIRFLSRCTKCSVQANSSFVMRRNENNAGITDDHIRTKWDVRNTIVPHHEVLSACTFLFYNCVSSWNEHSTRVEMYDHMCHEMWCSHFINKAGLAYCCWCWKQKKYVFKTKKDYRFLVWMLGESEEKKDRNEWIINSERYEWQVEKKESKRKKWE